MSRRKKRAKTGAHRLSLGRRLPMQGFRFWQSFMPLEADLTHLRESDSLTAHAIASHWQNRLLVAALLIAITPFLVSATSGRGGWSISDYLITAGLALLIGNLPLYFLSSWGRTKLLDSWPDIAGTRTRDDFLVTRSALNGAAATLLMLSLAGYSLLAWWALSWPFTGEGEIYWLLGMFAFEAMLGPFAYFIAYCFGQGWTLN